MHILWTLIVGFVVGLLARAVKPGDDSMGWIMTMLLGVAGAFLASFAGQALGLYRPGEPAGIIASVLGSVVLLALFAMFQRRRYA